MDRAEIEGFGFHQDRISGAVLLSFGGGFETRIGGTYASFSLPVDVEAFELHLISAPAAGYAVGVFAGRENYNKLPYDYTGVEVGHDVDTRSVEASVSDDTGEEFEATYATLSGRHDVTSKIAVLGGYSLATGDNAFDYLYVGAAYDVVPRRAPITAQSGTATAA